jgi:hypothetical protein
MIHSTEPEVRKQPLLDYLEVSQQRSGQKGWIDRWGQWFGTGKSAEFYGFRFMRLNEDALEVLQELDGPGAPRLTIFGNLKN